MRVGVADSSPIAHAAAPAPAAAARTFADVRGRVQRHREDADAGLLERRALRGERLQRGRDAGAPRGPEEQQRRLAAQRRERALLAVEVARG